MVPYGFLEGERKKSFLAGGPFLKETLTLLTKDSTLNLGRNIGRGNTELEGTEENGGKGCEAGNIRKIKLVAELA